MQKRSFLLLLFSGAFCLISVAQMRFSSTETQTHEKYVLKTVKLTTGVQLHFAEQGTAGGDPVIFLHGITDSWHSFEQVLPFLPPSVHAYALSLRGHGNSDKPIGGYTPTEFAQDIAAFMKELKIKSAVIVGHSMGGSIAQRFVLDYPELSKALVLVGSFASFQDKKDMIDLNKAFDQLQDPVNPAFISEFQKSTLSKNIDASVFNTYVNESSKLPARVWKAAMNGLMSADYCSELRKIDIPTLVIWGEKDAIVPETDQDILSSGIKKSRLIIYKNTGHAVHWEEPSRFANDLINFINKHL